MPIIPNIGNGQIINLYKLNLRTRSTEVKQDLLKLSTLCQRINWLKYKMSHQTSDSYHIVIEWQHGNTIIESQSIRKGKGARKREIQIKWLKLKICRQLDDSSRHLDKYGNSYDSNNNYVVYDQINWPEYKMCRQLGNNTYYMRQEIRPNNLICHCARIKWLKNKMCHHADDSYQPPDNYLGNNSYYTSRLIRPNNLTCHLAQINWLDNKLCLQLDDRLRSIIIKLGYTYAVKRTIDPGLSTTVLKQA